MKHELPRTFTVGDLVLYPNVGKGQIIEIATETVAGTSLEVVVIQCAKGTLRVPTKKAIETLHKLEIQPLQLAHAIKVLNEAKGGKLDLNTKKLDALRKKLHTGDPVQSLRVLSTLRRTTPTSATPVWKIFTQAMQHVLDGICAAEHILAKEALARLNTKLDDPISSLVLEQNIHVREAVPPNPLHVPPEACRRTSTSNIRPSIMESRFGRTTPTVITTHPSEVVRKPVVSAPLPKPPPAKLPKIVRRSANRASNTTTEPKLSPPAPMGSELREEELVRAQSELTSLRATVKLLREDLALAKRAVQDATAATSRVQTLERECGRLRQQLTLQDSTIDTLHRQLSAAQTDAAEAAQLARENVSRKKETEIAELQTALASQEKHNARTEQEKAALRALVTSCAKELATLRSERDALVQATETPKPATEAVTAKVTAPKPRPWRSGSKFKGLRRGPNGFWS